jgi:DNA-binding phage protein
MSKVKAAVAHHEAEVAELRSDRELAVEYLKAALESFDEPEDRTAGLLALRTVTAAYGEPGSRAGGNRRP